MTISTALKTVYASGGDMRIQTLTVELPSGEQVRLVNGYFAMMLGVNGQMVEFEPCGMEIDLPQKQEGGNQTLKFALGIMDDDRISALIEMSMESGLPAYLVYREYLATDVSAPALAPIRMTVQGGVFESNELGIEGSYFDMLNSKFPRQSYTIELAPGLKHQ